MIFLKNFRKAIFRAPAFAAVLLFFPACSAGPKYLAKDFYSSPRVAVLPFNNQTNDIVAPETVRRNLIEMLPLKGYAPFSKDAVDKILLEKFGITDGGQLPSVTKKELGQALGADALIYGEVLQFVDLPFGFVRRRSVRANVKLFDAKTETLLWEDQKGWTTPEFFLDAEQAKHAIARQVAERQMEKMAGTFLRAETRLMLELMLNHLPNAR